VLTRSQIIEAVWDFAYDGGSNVVNQYVNYLRRKIDGPFGRHDLETVRGMGYRLRHAGSAALAVWGCATAVCRLDDALRACARGIHPLEAGAGLLVDCGSWLHREDFTSRFITTGTSISNGAALLASIDWEAAVTALHAGELPASGGERRMLLLAASIAGGTPVSLNEALPGIDRRNASLVVRAVAHAAGLPDPYQETDRRE